MPDFDTYLSPFTWRYGTQAMRRLWSENEKRLTWRKIWVALAEVQAEYGLVTPEQAADLRQHMTEIDLPRALEIESELQHDLMAELRLYANQCGMAGGIIHLGATSTDIEDNTDVLRLRAALDLLLGSLASILRTLAGLIENWADTPMMAYTHLQPAEPSTLGYRLAMYGQDLLADYQALASRREGILGKGFKGAVGTCASYAELLGAENLVAFEQRMAVKLELAFFPVTSQVYPRRQDYEVISTLAGLGMSLYKMAFDLRLLQSPGLGELGEPFGEKQVGSSAMPFKRNPIHAEKIDSLGRFLAALPRLAWDNAAHSLLERTLDDSANRRILLPEACLAADELLQTSKSILEKLVINESTMANNLNIYGPFAASERLLMALVKAGADRQEMHERIRNLAMQAWQAVRLDGTNPLIESLCRDIDVLQFLPEDDIRSLMKAQQHIGDAPQRARKLAKTIRNTLEKKASGRL